MDTSFRPSMLSDAARARWMSPTLAAGLHGLAAAAILTGLSFAPPRTPDLGPSLMVELVPMAEPAPEPLPPVPAPAPPVARPQPAPAPRIVPKAAAPQRLSRPTPSAPVPDVVSPPTSEPAAEAPAAAASQPAAGTSAAGATTSPPVQQAYVPPMGRAGYLSNPKPSYPSLARKRGWEGTVTLLVQVDAAGNPVSVEVKESSGHSMLDHCATAAVRQWRFQPASRAGQSVAASVEVPIRFNLREENLTG